MIPFDFEYAKPATIREAVEQIEKWKEEGKKYVFYSGGTEFITFARSNKITAEAVVDIKGIPECNTLELKGDQLVIGSALSLNKIIKSGLFPLLGETLKGIADHTSRNKITIGGNMSSKLMYKEGILPFLLVEAKVKLAGRNGEITLPLEEIFNQEMKLDEDQFLVQIHIEKKYLGLPYVALKRTRLTKVGYPIVSVAALLKDDFIRVAFSGVCTFPFRSVEIEAHLNDSTISVEERINRTTAHLPSSVVDDIQGSAAYREFVLKRILAETVETLEGAM